MDGGTGWSGIGLPLKMPRGLLSSSGGGARCGASGVIAPSESVQFAKRSSNVVGGPGVNVWAGIAASDAPVPYAGPGDAPIRRLRYRIGLLVPGPLKLWFGSDEVDLDQARQHRRAAILQNDARRR
jgi:hypothetical protein